MYDAAVKMNQDEDDELLRGSIYQQETDSEALRRAKASSLRAFRKNSGEEEISLPAKTSRRKIAERLEEDEDDSDEYPPPTGSLNSEPRSPQALRDAQKAQVPRANDHWDQALVANAAELERIKWTKD